MREILTVQIGGAGLRIGSKIWAQLTKEHALDNMGVFLGTSDEHIKGIDVFFVETPCRYVPRCMFLDFPANTANTIMLSNLGSLFHNDSFLTDLIPIGNDFGSAYQSFPAGNMCTNYLDQMRKSVEMCDCFQGFEIVHSLAGGTGSGMTSLVLEETKSELANKQIYTCSVFPDTKHSEIVIQPYNCVLGIHRLIEFADSCNVLDNKSISNLWNNGVKKKKSEATLAAINEVIANVFSGITSSLRNPSNCNFNLKTLTQNLVPFPRLHFLLATHLPVPTETVEWEHSYTCEHLNQFLFHTGLGSIWISDHSPELGTWLTMAQLYRGKIDQYLLDTMIAKTERRQKHRFVDWIPNHIFTSITHAFSNKLTMTSLGNSTVMSLVLHDFTTQFKTMYAKGAFIHKFAENGITVEDLAAANNHVVDILEEYETYHQKAPKTPVAVESLEGPPADLGFDDINDMTLDEKDMPMDMREDLFLA